MQLPAGVLAMADRDDAWAGWVRGLPRLVDELVEEWGLTLDGDVTHGHCALVLPARTGDGEQVALKVGHVHRESEHEHLALRRWGGDGAVRLLRADPHRGALLLERLRPTDLGELWDVEACEVVGDLYRTLHVPALPQLRRLSDDLLALAGDLESLPRDAPVPRRLVEQATTTARALARDPATDAVLVHGDLHYANVLGAPHADRGVWLAIDPKPLRGDPHHEIAPLLWNRWPEVVEGFGGVREGVRRRFHAVVDAAGLDEDRAREHVVVRMLDLALDRLRGDAAGVRRTTPTDDLLTLCVSVAKAVQD